MHATTDAIESSTADSPAPPSRFEPDRAAGFSPRPRPDARRIGDDAALAYRDDRIRRWDAIARLHDRMSGWASYYHARLRECYQFLIPPGQRVLEIGGADGSLLASLRPSVGVGIDFSREMLKRAASTHPYLRFYHADAHEFALGETFDFIILSDLINDVFDVQAILHRIAAHCHPHTRIIVNWQSRVWEWPLQMTARLGLAKPTLSQNWLLPDDVANLMRLAGLEQMRAWREILLPLRVPGLTRLCNHILVKLWPTRALALTNFMIFAPQPMGQQMWHRSSTGDPSDALWHRRLAGDPEPMWHRRPAGDQPQPEPVVTVVVPCRNEAGNIAQILARTPELGGGTDLIFVEGNSTDDTYAAIERAIRDNPQRRCRLFRQPGRGKGDAVRTGFAEADGEVLMILDADLTVAPEDLPRFYEALRDGRGEFINGVRLVYPMESRAMRFFNLLGNRFFSAAFAWMLGQRVKDTLCGTKVLWKRDYERIAANRAYFGDFDPFGDFDLLFGAAKLNLRIVDMPIRYRERTYGTTNIQRWRHGWLLLKMVAFAAGRLKFV